MSPVDLAALIEHGAAAPAHEALYTAFILVAGSGLGAVFYAAGLGLTRLGKGAAR